MSEKVSQNDLLTNITTLMDARLSVFQQNIQASQKDISTLQMNRIQDTICDKYSFQRKGNENQYRHEAKVLTKLRETQAQLDEPGLDIGGLEVAKSKLKEGIDLVLERQKLIKLADSSELG
ncbi:hypothetical protein LOTGIDRAFT_154529 [Lottia gigantea]|uniref:Uncharacterized protein n=1 Tax=Lottia gigantea TaxID=225164 RepID=V3Z863_LOTGI|nr:hypothetical protein LOTGIDRAFT_154529 [Lottia gigantea]ESO87043.1 hypothetical protein LOTGIDRAFT_154529 [Lottia gigantea]